MGEAVAMRFLAALAALAIVLALGHAEVLNDALGEKSLSLTAPEMDEVSFRDEQPMLGASASAGGPLWTLTVTAPKKYLKSVPRDVCKVWWRQGYCSNHQVKKACGTKCAGTPLKKKHGVSPADVAKKAKAAQAAGYKKGYAAAVKH